MIHLTQQSKGIRRRKSDMKKRHGIIKASLAVILCLFISACGSQSAAGTTSTPEPSRGLSAVSRQETSSASQEDISSVPASSAEEVPDVASDTSSSVTIPQTEPEEVVSSFRLQKNIVMDYDWDETAMTTFLYTEYPLVRIAPEDASDYGMLTDAFALMNEERQKEAERFRYEESTNAEQDYYVDPDSFRPYYWKETAAVRRADSRAASILLVTERCVSGDDWTVTCTGMTYDTKTAALLTLDDIVTSREVLADLAEEQYRTNLSEDTDEISLLREQILGGADTLAYTLESDGLTLYSHSDIYAVPQSVKIPFSGHEGLFAPAYLQAPDAYAVEFSELIPAYADMGGNGTLDRLEVSGINEYDDYLYQTVMIWLNDENIEESDVYAYVLSPVLIHTKGGKTVLYLDHSTDNDYHNMTVYAKEGDGLKSVAAYPFGYYYEYGQDGDSWMECPQIPDKTRFTITTHTISTSTAHAFYRIDENGEAVNEDGFFTIDWDISLGAKVPISAEAVDEAGNTTGSVEIAEGESLTFIRTDNASWCDLKREDGSIARISFEYIDWTCYINGAELSTVLDGVAFAG